MTIPIWTDDLGCIQYPFTSKIGAPIKCRGYKAITRGASATIKVFCTDSVQFKKLFDFWKDTCNYGLEPFLIALPYMGKTYDKDFPDLLVSFYEDLSGDYQSYWETTINLKVLGSVDYVIDGNGDFILSDDGDFVIVDGQLISTNNQTQFKGIIYG